MCFLLGSAAADARDPSFQFEAKPIEIEDTVVTITENPLSRFLMAAQKQCDSQDEAMAMGIRVMAMLELFPHLPARFRKSDPAGGEMIHDSVITLAAAFPIKKTSFDRVKFFKRLEEIVNE